MSEWPQSEYLINRTHRFVLCPIPKVASSSLKQWFISTLESDEVAPYAMERPHKFLTEWKADQPRFDTSDFRVVVFVRNPWRRLVSGYLQKVVQRWDVAESPGRDIVAAVQKRRCGKVDYEEGITFREFVSEIAIRKIDSIDVHWRPQCLFLPSVTHASSTLFGRVESFQCDLSRIAAQLGLPEPASYSALRLDYDAAEMLDAADCLADVLRDMPRFPSWQSFYDDSLGDMVNRLYAVDIAEFGYENAGPLNSIAEAVTP